MRAIASRSEIPLSLDLGLIGGRKDATGESASPVISETASGILSCISELSCIGNVI